MLITKQQQFLLATLKKLGGARIDQLAALLRPVFCAEKPAEVAERLARASIDQLRYKNANIRVNDDIVCLPDRSPSSELLEAIDVMLELTEARPLDHWAMDSGPVLLRFSTDGPKIGLFAVTHARLHTPRQAFAPTERIIILLDKPERHSGLPIRNTQFFAIRQKDGTHRFFEKSTSNQ